MASGNGMNELLRSINQDIELLPLLVAQKRFDEALALRQSISDAAFLLESEIEKLKGGK